MIFFILIAYLLGSIPTGLWIGQRFYHINLREYGSGNTGTTNTFRILGIKAGLTTLAIDILKGTVATILPVLFGLTTVSPIVIGFFCSFRAYFSYFCQIQRREGCRDKCWCTARFCTFVSGLFSFCFLTSALFI
ncbi:glycerol-3-phosphate acyltransferase PlsY [Streptococcus dysgalactiae]|uniref:Glycerol-3-phosphate acyltransferase PlsY n=1 Tax=Streptococcus dysgalactiae TaxID=1334 RepID=A0A9X9QR53_STRDY|nr:glycerol-3-phosphate acyltransferase PlsY [Streptococcus dysgalactiae]